MLLNFTRFSNKPIYIKEAGCVDQTSKGHANAHSVNWDSSSQQAASHETRKTQTLWAGHYSFWLAKWQLRLAFIPEVTDLRPKCDLSAEILSCMDYPHQQSTYSSKLPNNATHTQKQFTTRCLLEHSFGEKGNCCVAEWEQALWLTTSGCSRRFISVFLSTKSKQT